MKIVHISDWIKVKRNVFLFVFFQGDEASAVQNVAESPVDTDPADVTEVRLHQQLLT